MKNDTIFLYLIASVSFLFCSNCAGRHNKTVEFGLAAQNGFTGGVVKSPFFKDTAVSEEVSPCPFCFFATPMIFTS